jgi:hypothetical protein
MARTRCQHYNTWQASTAGHSVHSGAICSVQFRSLVPLFGLRGKAWPSYEALRQLWMCWRMPGALSQQQQQCRQAPGTSAPNACAVSHAALASAAGALFVIHASPGCMDVAGAGTGLLHNKNPIIIVVITAASGVMRQERRRNCLSLQPGPAEQYRNNTNSTANYSVECIGA